MLPLFLAKPLTLRDKKGHELNQNIKDRLMILTASLAIVNSNGSSQVFSLHYELSVYVQCVTMTSHLLWLSRHDHPHFREEEKKAYRIEVNLISDRAGNHILSCLIPKSGLPQWNLVEYLRVWLSIGYDWALCSGSPQEWSECSLQKGYVWIKPGILLASSQSPAHISYPFGKGCKFMVALFSKEADHMRSNSQENLESE